MDSCYDPLCFTKQTATLLRGLGVPELIPECKKRNISTDVLFTLSTKEFATLDISPERSQRIKDALNRNKECGIPVTNISDRLQHCLEIIKHQDQHLSLIQAFVAYCRLRLVKERINIFVNPNKCLSASEILPISVNATLIELEEAEQNLSELEKFILKLQAKPKRTNTRRLYFLISGVGLVAIVLLKMCMP